MPKSRPARTASDPAEPQKPPVERARDAADAMFRAATECCHQHDRVARVHAKSAVEEEVRAAQDACEACDEILRDLSRSYEEAAAALRPVGEDESWWHRANALWLASREYLRRNGGCDDATRQLKAHGPDRFESLHTEYELEASALLALRQAAANYRQGRPSAE